MKRLHTNMGHPPTQTMIRILKAGKATQEAIQCARELQCDISVYREASHLREDQPSIQEHVTSMRSLVLIAFERSPTTSTRRARSSYI